MLLHAERPLGISLRILPCNLSIQACIKSVGNHAIVFGLRKQGKIPVFIVLWRLPRPAPNFTKLT